MSKEGKAEKWFKEKLKVPENWDKFDYELPNYSFNDMVDFAEQYADQEVEEALKERQKRLLTKIMDLDSEARMYDL